MPQGFCRSACCRVLDEYIARDNITIAGFTKLGSWARTIVFDHCCWKATFSRNGATYESLCEIDARENRQSVYILDQIISRDTRIARDAVRELILSPVFFSNGLEPDERFVGCKYVLLAKSYDYGYVQQLWQLRDRRSSKTFSVNNFCQSGCGAPCSFVQLVTSPFQDFILEYCSQSPLLTKTWIRVRTTSQIPQGEVVFSVSDATITQANQKIFCETLQDSQFNPSDQCLGIPTFGFPSCDPSVVAFFVDPTGGNLFPCVEGSKFFSRDNWIINFGPSQ